MTIGQQIDLSASRTATAAIVAERPVLLIDFSSLWWTNWHASGEEEISTARRRTLESVERCIGDRRDQYVAICCDSGRSFRKDMLPEYKAQRPEKDHASLAEMDRAKDKLRDDGFLLWEAKGFEADDVIATACELAVRRGHEVVIASADKDLLQLARPKVKALRTHNWSDWTVETVIERFGVAPDLLGDWLALVGDASDNIPGCPSVGPKTATALLQKHGSLDSLWEALEIDPKQAATPNVARALTANVENVKLARKLVALRSDVPIEFEQLYEPRKRKTSANRETTDMDTPDPEFTDIPISNGPGPAAQAKPAVEAAPAAPAAPVNTPAPEPVNASPAAPPSNGNGNGNGGEHSMIVVPQVMAPGSGAFEMALEPTSMGTAWKLAQALWDSRLYVRFPTAEAIFAVVIRGREMGIPALTALDLFHIIEGKPAPHAHFIIARAESHPDCEYFQLLHSDNAYAEYETKNRRHKGPITHRYSIEDAVDAGLCGMEIVPRTAKPGEKDGRGQWDKRRKELLRKTCGVQLARIAYPSAAMGLYSIAELGGEE